MDEKIAFGTFGNNNTCIAVCDVLAAMMKPWRQSWTTRIKLWNQLVVDELSQYVVEYHSSDQSNYTWENGANL